MGVHTEPEIRAFLKARRAALDPAELGLPDGITRRRVRGLRREEVAQLAGISVDYYTRIEQGRANAISEPVLDAIERALRLTAAEARYLRNIAGPRRPAPAPEPERHVRPEIRHLLDALDETVPAYIQGPGMDVLAWNRLAARLAFDYDTIEPARRNNALLIFLDPSARTLHLDWEEIAESVVGNLRAEAGRSPESPRLCAVICELLDHSADFRRLWEAQSVQERCSGTKRVRHPEAGELVLCYESFRLPQDSEQSLCTYTAPRDSPTERKLRELARGVAVGAP
ncbi:transcriptional regulator [Streptomyces sp. WAC 06783]|uniref:helix-turn-helix transcriptional regulator n=1 Tax=Streptomyces sp. WAC 06783 TaxID=2203211 RepID=UPI000F73B89A|nr:helix-turn-helix transcriptional regulator [Streptomyces sp. WAC 06783]RSO13471.1 transcriptional regulator [Streptomyces sp. WAC 06783]